MTTVITFLIGYPMAYTIAFRGGRFKNALLLVVVLPFFVSFVIRTLNWSMILSDNGMVFGTLKDLGVLDPSFRFLATPASVIFGLTYNFLPFMILPLYVALEKIDRRLIEAGDRPLRQPLQAFWRITFVLSLPGVVAGSLLTFIPAVGDFINAEIIGAGNPDVDHDRQRHPVPIHQRQRLPRGGRAGLRARDRGHGAGRDLHPGGRQRSG